MPFTLSRRETTNGAVSPPSSLPKKLPVSDELLDCAKVLDKHYILTRYPNGFDSGAPTDLYTRKEEEEALACAEKIIEFCRHKIRES